MPSTCIAPVQGTRARITRLDECGLPVTGAGSVIVFDGFVQVGLSPQYEDGTEYQKRQANGVFCVNRRGPDQFTRQEITLEFCAIDPDAVAITTGQEIIMTGTTGTGFWIREGEATAHWALEVWQADSETCTGDVPRFGYWLFPNLAAARINDSTIEDDIFEWTVVANSEKTNPGFTLPAPTYVPMPIPPDVHAAFNITTVAPPAVTNAGCGAAALASA